MNITAKIPGVIDDTGGGATVAHVRGSVFGPLCRLVAIAGALVAALPAWAAEPSGCDKFKWPVDRERAALTAPPLAVESGATTAPPANQPLRIALRPAADAKLPTPPERAPKDEGRSFAGFVRLSAVPAPGIYAISLSAAAWLDAIQDGKPLKTVAFSGATDCDGIRKIVKFELRAEPLLLQFSGVASDSIILAITPSP